jgi:Kdo2-lipid IVA lauroyltransferase/acyltransferase
MNFLKKLLGKTLKSFAWMIWISPLFLRRFFGAILGLIWFDVLRLRRDVVKENIRRAFPEMSDREVVRLGRASLFNLGQNFLEYSFLPFMSSKNVSQVVHIQGKEHLAKALELRKGVLMLTLHVGHGDIAVAALSIFGFPMALVSKFFKLKWLNDLWFGMREKVGTEFIPPRDSSFKLLKKLKEGKVVVIPLDQFTGPPIGVKTTFFGVETGTAAGLALMALRSKAPVVPAYVYRDEKGIHQIEVLPAVDLEVFRESEDPSLNATQHFNYILEDIVRKYPSQWMWIHRRWKRFVV